MATQDRVPTGDGNATWSLSSGSTRWELVDDAVGAPDDDTTYIYVTGMFALQILTYADFAITSTSINKVVVTYRMRHLTGNSTQGRAEIYVGITPYAGSYNNLTDTYTDYTEEWLTNPATAAAWTEADVEGTGGNPLEQWRVRNNLTSGAESVRCTQTYISVDYNTAVAHTPFAAFNGPMKGPMGGRF